MNKDERPLGGQLDSPSNPWFAEFASMFLAGYCARKDGIMDDNPDAFGRWLMGEYQKWEGSRFRPPLLSTGTAFTTIHEALSDPEQYTRRLTLAHEGGRPESMERWQTRAVMAAIGKLERR